MAMKRPEVNFSYFELQRFQAVETCPKNGCSVTLRFALFGGWKNDKRKGLSSNDPFFTCNVSFREGNNIPQMVVKDGVFLLMTQNLQLEIFGLWKNFEFSKLKTASFSQALRAGQVTSEISQDLLQRTERSKSQQKNTKISYWLVVSTYLKNISRNGNLPQVWVKIKYLKPPVCLLHLEL